MNNTCEPIFYVYQYIRKDGTPYYIGKKRKPMSPESKAKLSEKMKQVRANKKWSPKGTTI